MGIALRLGDLTDLLDSHDDSLLVEAIRGLSHILGGLGVVGGVGGVSRASTKCPRSKKTQLEEINFSGHQYFLSSGLPEL